MDSISQKHSLGCAVACVAFTLGFTYGKALRLFEKPKNAALRGFYCKDVVKALGKANAEYSYSYLKPNKRSLLKAAKSIVYLRKGKRYPLGHYLAKPLDGLWMDPWINFPKIPIESGFRKRLPEKAIYVIYPKNAQS